MTKKKAFSIEASMERLWEESFRAQMDQNAYNTAPVESIVRTVSHHLRSKKPAWERHDKLEFLEVGCGAGANLAWLAESGIQANGVDISPTAIGLCERLFKKRGLKENLGQLVCGNAMNLEFDDQSFDGVIESCVFQHLSAEVRVKAFSEVVRVLKPGGLFVGYMLSFDHTTFQNQLGKTSEIEPGTLILGREGSKEKLNLEDIGLSHFFAREEFATLLDGCSIIDPCQATYELPREEAARRGYKNYKQAMWIVFAIK